MSGFPGRLRAKPSQVESGCESMRIGEANGWAAATCSGKRLLRNVEGSSLVLAGENSAPLGHEELDLELAKLLVLWMLSGVKGGVMG